MLAAAIGAVALGVAVLAFQSKIPVWFRADWRAGASFLIAAGACYWPGGPLATWLCHRWSDFVRRSHRQPAHESYGPTSDALGRLERTLIVYAVLANQVGLITVWIILKGFFSWIDTEAARDPAGDASRSARWYHYHTYVGGNLISLGVGLAFGELAKLIVHAAG